MAEATENSSEPVTDFSKVIKDYSIIAATCIEEQDFENALEALYHSRDLLTACEEQGATINLSFWVETFHNSALCYQRYFLSRLGRLDDCVSCLEECLFILKDKTPWEVKCHKHLLNTSKDYLEKITGSKYKCKVNIQLCAILSQLDRHESALIHAKKALEKAQRAIAHCFEICSDHVSLHKKLIGYAKAKTHHSQYKLLESQHYIYFTNLVNFAFPIIKSLNNITKKTGVPESAGKRHNLSSYLAEWLMGFQIGDMMTIDYLNFNELKTRTGIDDEISTDLLLEKICFLTISAYCIGTEVRKLSCQKFSKYGIEDAKSHYFLSKNYADFLPRNSLLYGHVNTTYYKIFGDEQIDESIVKITKDISTEKLKRKSTSPGVETIHKPKSLKIIKKVSPLKKSKQNLRLSKLVPHRKNSQPEGSVREKISVEQIIANRSEPDPETI